MVYCVACVVCSVAYVNIMLVCGVVAVFFGCCLWLLGYTARVTT